MLCTSILVFTRIKPKIVHNSLRDQLKILLTGWFILFSAAWWQQHGINCLELQQIAVRILSQTCSSFGCEHNWSTFDQIHSQRHNRIAQKRLNDIIYVHYNLRLRERQIRKRSCDSISLDGLLEETLLYDWIVETEKQAVLEDEVTINHMLNTVIYSFYF